MEDHAIDTLRLPCFNNAKSVRRVLQVRFFIFGPIVCIFRFTIKDNFRPKSILNLIYFT